MHIDISFQLIKNWKRQSARSAWCNFFLGHDMFNLQCTSIQRVIKLHTVYGKLLLCIMKLQFTLDIYIFWSYFLTGKCNITITIQCPRKYLLSEKELHMEQQTIIIIVILYSIYFTRAMSFDYHWLSTCFISKCIASSTIILLSFLSSQIMSPV